MNLDNIKGKKILIVGDIMLDTYYVGDVKRISPEAPVPVVRVNSTYTMLGGAANVANNLIGLGCNPLVVGVIGRDANGAVVREKLAEYDIESIIETTEYPTITKSRILGNNQQVLRVDFESENFSLCEDKLSSIISAIGGVMPKVDIVVISDYNKGFCTPALCQKVIELAKVNNKNVIVDPKGKSWEKYRGATVITPNLKELSDISEMEINNDDASIAAVATEVISKLNLSSLLVTRSEKGISYISKEFALSMPTEAREVADVSGAGDTVVATLSASLAAGFSIEDAISLSNRAAGIVVGKMGTTPILFNELKTDHLLSSSHSKIVTRGELTEVIRLLRLQNRRIVFTNGCFDIIHCGHTHYLEKAKSLGDILIVALNSDSSVRRIKGDDRPINNELARSTVMSALASVDYVVIFEEDTPLEVIKDIKPDVLVKGGDYNVLNIVGREYAGETTTISFVDGYSTTKIIKAIGEKSPNEN